MVLPQSPVVAAVFTTWAAWSDPPLEERMPQIDYGVFPLEPDEHLFPQGLRLEQLSLAQFSGWTPLPAPPDWSHLVHPQPQRTYVIPLLEQTF